MSRIIACLAATLAAAVLASAVAGDDLATELETCQAVEDESDRLACYDELAASMAPSAGEETAALILDDDVAKTEVKGANVEQPVYTAAVTRCEQAKQEQRLYFFMENGQVWQQSNAKRLRLKDKDCQFDVTITKDGFGWILKIPSEDRRIRVRRVR